MLQHAREFDEAGHPVHFRSGPGPADVHGEELLDFVRMAEYVTVNDYEAQMLQERTGKTIEELSKLVERFRGHTGGARFA